MAMSDAVAQALAAVAAAEREGRIGEAASLLEGLGAAIQDRPAALHLAGVVAARQGDFARAAPLMDRAAKQGAKDGLDPAVLALVHRNRIEAHRRLLNPKAAIAAGREALALVPDDAVALNNLALAHFDALEIDAAIACYDRAIALAPEDPGPRFGRGEVLLACGDFARGWEGYGWRFRLPGVPQPLPPEVLARKRIRRWQGRAMAGTLLVVADQGFGDVVQFARYLPWAAGRCGRLLVAASPEMQPVVAQMPGVAERVTAWDRLGPFDAWAALSDLPGLAGMVEAPGPYLAGAHEDRMRWAARLAELLPRGMRRVGPAAAQLGASTWRAPLVNLGPEIAGYADTMAVLDGLDLVVTVDTSVAHVAGAMGKPCWLLLARRPDWRWGLAGEATGWYPSVRLFRQKRLGDWAGVAREVARALQE